MEQTHFDTVIIGDGAAGLSAAQTLGRSLRSTLVVDAGDPRNRFAARMHNVLGLDGVPPGELVERGRAEARAYGVEFAAGSVTSVRDAGENLVLELAHASAGGDPTLAGADPVLPGADPVPASSDPVPAPPRQVTARAVVVASGVRDELPAIPGLADYWGSTVLHCPYCHGWEVRGGRLAVLATSPASLHQVLLLRQWSSDVTVFGAALGALDPATERAIRARGMKLVSSPVAEVLGDGERVTGVRTADGAAHEVDAIFTMSQMTPRDGFLDALAIERTAGPFGSFLAVDGFGRTSHPRVWAVGNVAAPMATVPVAMGAGAAAAGSVNFALVEEDFALAAKETR